MAEALYHPTTPEITQRRKQFAPHVHDAFEAFSQAVFAGGAYAHSTLALETLDHTQANR